jgi:hypothetical protein
MRSFGAVEYPTVCENASQRGCHCRKYNVVGGRRREETVGDLPAGKVESWREPDGIRAITTLDSLSESNSLSCAHFHHIMIKYSKLTLSQ